METKRIEKLLYIVASILYAGLQLKYVDVVPSKKLMSLETLLKDLGKEIYGN